MGLRTDFTSLGAIGVGAFAGLVGTAALFASGGSHHSNSESCITVRSISPSVSVSVDAGIPDVAIALQSSGERVDAQEIADVVVRVPRPAITAEYVEAEAVEAAAVAEAPDAPEAPAPAVTIARAVGGNVAVISDEVHLRSECVAEVAELREHAERMRHEVRAQAEEARTMSREMRAESEALRAEFESEEFEARIEALRAEALENGEVDARWVQELVREIVTEAKARAERDGN